MTDETELNLNELDEEVVTEAQSVEEEEEKIGTTTKRKDSEDQKARKKNIIQKIIRQTRNSWKITES